MDILKKLAELLDDACWKLDEIEAEMVAEELVAKGVTVQEWIPISVALPAIREKVLVYGSHGGIYTAYLVQGKPFPEWHKVGGKNSYCNPTHWMYRPKPPKRKRS